MEEMEMNNTAVRAKKVLFISEAHEKFYNKQLNKTRRKDVCQRYGRQVEAEKL